MKYLRDVVTLSFDPARCTGCAVCTLVCPHGVFALRDGKAFITDRDRCIECGACANNCAAKAISVKAGVGCAAAMINGIIRTGDPSKGTCGCSEKGCC
jgi:NAD-dependent dihydropyrimidine dehydrogenase PreA subunit